MNIQLYKTKLLYKEYVHRTTIKNIWKAVCPNLGSIKLRQKEKSRRINNMLQEEEMV